MSLDAVANLLLAVLLAFIGGGYLAFRSRRDKIARIGESFNSVVAGLGSDDQVRRVTSAALMGRFMDKRTEYGLRGLPYRDDVIRVVTGVLRTEPTGPVQKILSDTIGKQSLEKRDLQHTNLRSAFWAGSGEPAPLDGEIMGTDAREADFYRADLSEASLRRAVLKGAKFREALLVRTVLEGADCSGAGFQQAKMTGARMTGANLAGANFSGACICGANLTGVQGFPDCLDDLPGSCRQDEVVASAQILELLELAKAKYAESDKRIGIFISAPAVVPGSQQFVVDQVIRLVMAAGHDPIRVTRDSYRVSPLDAVRGAVAEASGAIILSLPQLEVGQGAWRAGTDEEVDFRGWLPTPWNEIEAGMAAQQNLPMFVLRYRVSPFPAGIAGLQDAGRQLRVFDISDSDSGGFEDQLRHWLQCLAP